MSHSPVARHKGGGDGGEVRHLRLRGPCDQAPAGIAAVQRAAHLDLELVDRLVRVPRRGPEAGHQGRGRLAGIGIHRERHRRVRIVRRLRLVNVQVGGLGRAAAYAVRFARNLLAVHAEGSGRRDAEHVPERGHRLRHGRQDGVEVGPRARREALGGRRDLAQPPPRGDGHCPAARRPGRTAARGPRC